MTELEDLGGDERRGVAQRHETEAYVRFFGLAVGLRERLI